MSQRKELTIQTKDDRQLSGEIQEPEIGTMGTRWEKEDWEETVNI